MVSASPVAAEVTSMLMAEMVSVSASSPRVKLKSAWDELAVRVWVKV